MRNMSNKSAKARFDDGSAQVDALENQLLRWEEEDAWWKTKDILRSRKDPEAKALLRELDKVDDDTEKFLDRLSMDPPPRKSVRDQIAAKIRVMGQLRQRIIRDAQKLRPPDKTAKKKGRPQASARAAFGVLDRVGAAYSALTATPADPGSPAYKTSLAAAKKNAAQVVGNYKFMRDKVAARQQSMDKYVQGAIKAINASSNVNDVQHFIEQLEIAVRAMSTILSSVKTPFARPGAKVRMAQPSLPKGKGLSLDKQDALIRKFQTLIEDESNWLYQFTDKMEAHLRKGDFTTQNAMFVQEMLKEAKALGFSRPGAKAKMAAFEGSYAEIRVRYEFPDGTTDMETMSGPARSAAASAIRRITAKGNGAKAWVIGMRPADPRGRFPAGQVEIWKGEVVDGRAYERGGSFSRPGAKVTAEKPSDLEREDVKAGLKLMEKADPAVSDKIRTLIKEGKPQDQAVAIALDMKRRGEL